jgi:hypothetical protein
MSRHRHQWIEVKRTFNPATHDVTHMRGGMNGDTRKLVLGWTNIELRCSDCGELKFTTVDGEA